MLNNIPTIAKVSNNLFAAKCNMENVSVNYLWDEKRIIIVNSLIELSQKLLNDKTAITDIENQLKEINKEFKNLKNIY